MIYLMFIAVFTLGLIIGKAIDSKDFNREHAENKQLKKELKGLHAMYTQLENENKSVNMLARIQDERFFMATKKERHQLMEGK